MTSLYTVSYVLLLALVVTEAGLLHAIVHDTLWLQRLLRNDSRRLPRGTPVPPFVVASASSGRSMSSAELKGRNTMLLFVDPEAAPSPFYRDLATAAHALWHKTDGNLFIVCKGALQDCTSFIDAHRVDGLHGVSLLVDPKGEIADLFAINWTPQAVWLDAEARVRQYGHPTADAAWPTDDHADLAERH